MTDDLDRRLLGYLAQAFDEQVAAEMTGYDAARQIINILRADGYEIVQVSRPADAVPR